MIQKIAWFIYLIKNVYKPDNPLDHRSRNNQSFYDIKEIDFKTETLFIYEANRNGSKKVEILIEFNSFGFCIKTTNLVRHVNSCQIRKNSLPSMIQIMIGMTHKSSDNDWELVESQKSGVGVIVDIKVYWIHTLVERL